MTARNVDCMMANAYADETRSDLRSCLLMPAEKPYFGNSGDIASMMPELCHQNVLTFSQPISVYVLL